MIHTLSVCFSVLNFLLLFGNEMIYGFESCCTLQDYNEDGELSLAEFSDLIDAFGNKLAAEKVRI